MKKEEAMEKECMKKEDAMEKDVIEKQAVQDIIAILDAYNESGGSRMKIQVTQGDTTTKEYHHGRCDVCSPFAKGQAFDVLE